MIRMTGPPDAVLRSLPVSSLCRCAADYNLCQSQPRRVYHRLREPRGGRPPEETAVPIGFLSDAGRERLDGFPAQIVPGDIETYFTLSRADRRQVPRTASPANRLGFALQLGTLRFLGFCPDDLSTVPEAVVAFVARQLDVAPGELARYGRRGQTRTEHLRQIRRYLGFRKATAGDLAQLEDWLVDRALEHDRPTLLLRLACEHLLGLRIERPGITHLERRHRLGPTTSPAGDLPAAGADPDRGLQGPARRLAGRPSGSSREIRIGPS